MTFEINDIIKFNNGEYLVLDIINKDDNKYLYLINNDEFENDISITKVIENSGIIQYTFIDDSEEFNYVLNRIFLDMKEDILDYVIEED